MNTTQMIAEALAAALEIPPSYYEKAHDRYNDLGRWFGRPGSLTEQHSPRIYGQGSFRLGTVIRPLTAQESYDLDVGCRLESGISKYSHSQKKLKQLVGRELEAYRQARHIESPLDEKHRCWRLEYADELPFHMDVVPSIPEEMNKRASLATIMEAYGLERALSQSVAQHSGNITDNRCANYDKVDPDWKISNSEGYALWFESRLSLAKTQMEKVALMASRAKVDKLPVWKWKTPLQQAIQILKRHRDTMFTSNPDSKPISIILTTLAAKAYNGEDDVGAAITTILNGMDSHIRPTRPQIPNPVNPNEDFADKWYDPKYSHLNLEGNFRRWILQARADLKNLDRLPHRDAIEKFLHEKFRIRIPGSDLDAIALLLPPTANHYSSVQVITEKPARPWSDCTGKR
jgi:hypothetical protein